MNNWGNLGPEGWAEQFGMEFIELKTMKIPANVIAMLSKEVCLKYRILPVDVSYNVLTLAVHDPMDLTCLDEIGNLTGIVVEPILARPNAITEAIHRFYK